MLHKQLSICFFVGYLGLLLNLGPSLHHAPIFGLHGQDNEAGSCQHSCCGHSHAPPAQQTSNDNSVVSTNVHHDCSFCKFFDQLHVVVVNVETIEVSDFAFLLEAIRSEQPPSVKFSPLARGPPSFA
jgi:hypothetical protein